MKRVVSALLCLCMLVSVLSTGAFAANDAAEMKTVLSQVKAQLDIPAALELAYYEKNGEDWRFIWQGEEDQITVYCDEKARIVSYYFSEFNRNTEEEIPQILRTEALSKVNSILKRALPEAYDQLNFEKASIATSGRNYYITIPRWVNGYPCKNQNVNVGIDYSKGEIRRLNVTWDYGRTFPKVAEPISEMRAREAWRGNAEMELSYRVKTEKKNDQLTNRAYLVYTPVEEIAPINAVNGEPIDDWIIWEESGKGLGAGGAPNEAQYTSDQASVYLNEGEIKKAQEYADLLSAEDAKKIVAQYPELSLSQGYTFSTAMLCKSYRGGIQAGENGDQYEWRLTYRGKVVENDGYVPKATVTVHAKTGEILEYYNFTYYDYSVGDDKAKEIVTQEQAAQIAQGFLKKVQSARFAETRPDHETPFPTTQFSFQRYHEDIPVTDEKMHASVDKTTGKIVEMSYQWTDDLKFESLDGILTAEGARDRYIEQAGALLQYIPCITYYYDEKGEKGEEPYRGPISDLIPHSIEVFLAYTLRADSNYLLARDGTIVDYSGEPLHKEQEFTGYKDIGTGENARTIALLGDAAILPQTENFTPKAKTTQKEFIDFLVRACDMGNDYYRYVTMSAEEKREYNYELAMEYGIIEDSEIAPDRAISRYEAVLFCVRAAGYGALCKDASIYRVNYGDAARIPSKYLGAVALAKTTKIYVANGVRFDGDVILSRADAAQLIYGFLARIKK